MEAVGNRIFLAGNIHFSSATLYSVLLATDDAGKRGVNLTRACAAPCSIIPVYRLRDRLDQRTGIGSGAQDPFLLLTSDSGKTWRRRPVSAKVRAGTISHSGSMTHQRHVIIDRTQSDEDGRYELYESMTGGESWMLRGNPTKSRLRMKHVFTPNTDWRIRPDGRVSRFASNATRGKMVATSEFPGDDCSRANRPRNRRDGRQHRRRPNTAARARLANRCRGGRRR